MPEPNSTARKQALTAESIAPADSVVITIADIREVDVPDDERAGGYRPSTIIECDEFPGHIYWMKPAGRSIIRMQLGSNVAKWINRKLPLKVERVLNPRTNEEVDVLNVAPLREWEPMLRENAKRTAKPRPTAKKAK